MHATFCGLLPGEGLGLLPRHARHWWPLIEDIFNSEPVQLAEANIFAELVRATELQCISIDTTLRCTLPLLGQAHPKASRAAKAAAAFSGASAKTRPSCSLSV